MLFAAKPSLQPQSDLIFKIRQYCVCVHNIYEGGVCMPQYGCVSRDNFRVLPLSREFWELNSGRQAQVESCSQ